MKINKHGNNEIHGADVKYCLPSLIIEPHSGVGTFTPIPKKLRPASDNNIFAKFNVSVTISKLRIFGRICFSNISISLNPANLAAVTYNSDFSFKVADLAKRANNIQSLIANAIIALYSPPPNIPAIAIAINICGNAKKRSQIAINTSSKRPPV